MQYKLFSDTTISLNNFLLVKRHIPNLLTSLNLVSGCIASYYAANANLEFALYFMLLGLIFDFFDGFTARLLGVSSPIGKELDSLADVITFGLTPSLTAYVALYWCSSILSSPIGSLFFLCHRSLFCYEIGKIQSRHATISHLYWTAHPGQRSFLGRNHHLSQPK